MPRKPPRLKMMKPRIPTAEYRTVVPPADLRTGRAIKKTDSFYGSSEWQQLRKAVVAERGRICEECGAQPDRLYVDHRTELRDGGEPLERSNLQVLCSSCHVRKTYRARGTRMRS